MTRVRSTDRENDASKMVSISLGNLIEVEVKRSLL